jgi:hypothetical protein
MQQGSRLLLKYAKKKKFQLVQPSGWWKRIQPWYHKPLRKRKSIQSLYPKQVRR